MVSITNKKTGSVNYFNVKDIVSIFKSGNNLTVVTVYGSQSFKSTDVDFTMTFKGE